MVFWRIVSGVKVALDRKEVNSDTTKGGQRFHEASGLRVLRLPRMWTGPGGPRGPVCHRRGFRVGFRLVLYGLYGPYTLGTVSHITSNRG